MIGTSRITHPLVRLLVERLLIGLVTLWVVLTLIFIAVNFLPGDLAEVILGMDASPEAVAAIRRDLGLDEPLLQRYVAWIGQMVQGDFGRSYATKREISDLLASRLTNTLFLAGLAAAIAVPLALTLGVLAALYRNSFYDRAVNGFSLAAMSLPDFFVAYILIVVLATKLQIFPSMSPVDVSTPFWTHVYRCLLPALTLSLISIAHMMRMTRAAIINLMASAYIEMAHLKGVPRRRVVLWHALPNAIPPIINVVMFNLAWLIVGVVVVEVVFAYPGLGQVLVDSVGKRDVPVVQACSLIFASTYVLLNLLADIFSLLSNPRILHPR